jgi:hypothetical protein
MGKHDDDGWRGYSGTLELGDFVMLSIRHVADAEHWLVSGVITNMGYILGAPALQLDGVHTVLLSDLEPGGVLNMSETRA